MNVQPIERNTVSYFLFFEKENLTIQIDKPIGLEKAIFEIKQNQNGFGRYLTFADSIDLTFSPRANDYGHQFKKLCEIYKIHKWQTKIFLILKIDEVEMYRGRLKMNSVDTDYMYYFRCKIDVNNQREIIEAKKSENINLLSVKSIDDKLITPIEMVDLLTKFKKYFAVSKLSSKDYSFPYTINTRPDGIPASNFVYFYLFNELISGTEKIEIRDVFVSRAFWMSSTIGNKTHYNNDTNQNVVMNVTLDDIDLTVDVIPNEGCIFQVIRSIVEYDNNGTANGLEDTVVFTTSNSNMLKIDHLIDDFIAPPQSKIQYLFQFSRNNSSIIDITEDTNYIIAKRPKLEYRIIDVYEDTVTKANRLIDIGKQTLKSITNDAVSVVAPRFTEPGGNFYDIYGTSGLFLRQFNDQPYYATWKGFVAYIRTSFNCDYQINGTEVFIGHESDFYQNVEIGRLLFSANKDSFSTKPNDRLVKSNFTLGYDKYEDDKSSSNTIDSIHVKSEWYLANSEPLEDAKIDNNINYIADAYMIENTRRESFDKDSTKTIPNDKGIYVIDAIINEGVLMNRTNEGFEIENLYSPETAYNVRLSVKRLIIDYFSQTLSNISQWTKDSISWKNTSYINNQKAKTKADETVVTTNLELVEADDIIPEYLPDPNLEGDEYRFDMTYRMKLNEFWELANKIINDKGFVTFYDEFGTEVKIFISGLKYAWEDERIYNIIGEKKYE